MINTASGCLLFLLLSNVYAETLTGRVVKIADGDTLTMLVDHRQMKVRLAEIDAPEKTAIRQQV